MTIGTKYNIVDEVWYKGYKELFCDKVFNIRITVDSNGNVNVEYDLWGDIIKNECLLFPTKEELLRSL